jgi:superfamily II DNA/RNA helicase
MDMFTPPDHTLEDMGLPIKLEGPEGDDYKERIESASRFEELGLYVILFVPFCPLSPHRATKHAVPELSPGTCCFAALDRFGSLVIPGCSCMLRLNAGADNISSREPMLQAIYHILGYKKPSRVQATALPLIMGPNRPSLLCQSQTGTGKTACFALAMIHRIDTSRDVPQALIVAPTRELARQIITYINRVCQREVDVVTALAVPGGFDKKRPFDAHIIVGTPGTVVECLRRKLIDPTHIKMLVMDEADNLLDMQGLGDHAIRVKRYMPADIQVLLFSATFSDTVLTFADSFAPGAIRMTVPRHELTMNGIKQVYIDLNSEEEKYRILVELYHTMCVGSSIIFCKVCDPPQTVDSWF